MPEDDNAIGKEATFWDHLEELRGVAVRGVAITAVIAVGLFAVMPKLFAEVVMAPCEGDFYLYRIFTYLTAEFPILSPFSSEGWHVSVVNINLASQFFIHMQLSLLGAVVVSVPVWLCLLWNFISPGLYTSERRHGSKALWLGGVLFYIGMAVGYFVVFPLTLRFLADYQLSPDVSNQISLDSYIDNFLGMLFAMGLVGEIPVVCALLGRIGVLSRRTFSKYRRHAIVVLLVVAAIITPTGDPFTLSVVFVPLFMLWELGGRLIPRDK